jgi:hypothetical protein
MTPPPVHGDPVRELNPSIVARVNGFVLGVKPDVPVFQLSEVAPRVPDKVSVSDVIVEPELFIIPNATGLPPKVGSRPERFELPKLNGVAPLQVVAPPHDTKGTIMSWGSTMVSATALTANPRVKMLQTAKNFSAFCFDILFSCFFLFDGSHRRTQCRIWYS